MVHSNSSNSGGVDFVIAQAIITGSVAPNVVPCALQVFRSAAVVMAGRARDIKLELDGVGAGIPFEDPSQSLPDGVARVDESALSVCSCSRLCEITEFGEMVACSTPPKVKLFRAA